MVTLFQKGAWLGKILRYHWANKVMSLADFEVCACLAMDERIEIVKNNVDTFPDFPKPGILFRDIFSVMRKPEAFQALQGLINDHVRSLHPKADVVVGLDARGFLLGPLVASHFSIPFVPVRKKGKLPGKLHQASFTLEYGTDIFEIQAGSIAAGQNVLVIDDLIATGGSLQATCKLVEQMHAKVLQCFVVMELVDLKGRDKIPAPVHSLLKFEEH